MFPVDLALLDGVQHMPSLPVLERSMGRRDLRLHDFCILIRLTVDHRSAYDAARLKVVRDSQAFHDALGGIGGLTVFPTNANFVYCRLDDRISGVALRDRLLCEHGCFVRECGSKIGSDSQFLRIAARLAAEQRLLWRPSTPSCRAPSTAPSNLRGRNQVFRPGTMKALQYVIRIATAWPVNDD